MAEIFTVINPKTKESQVFERAYDAGAAFYKEERADRPSVMHAQEDRDAPGGRFGRFMAETEIHGEHDDGEKKYIKTLPNVRDVDADFRAGYLDALETSVRERLKSSEPGGSTPKLDNRLKDDLETLAHADKGRAASAWKDSAPAGVSPPSIIAEGELKKAPARASNEPMNGGRGDYVKQLEQRRSTQEADMEQGRR